ncbi:hypothetical protein H8356DRAFT_922828 [Neocallimastix lanati (nom. inval.)]|jgi:pre-rRNA-processing protein TSR2|uniref:Pre-rRNA-processing protein TSR2 n=1 Tax=Neocallimastix californiae TaxID=1754190 RepID=A0A1Y2DKP9_9FUNG|nr:hypothetical protein H8356DRAFT_922828 [Neocallimastix sp. JGI-2020a]ORY59802.1 hypothetical protein LY90DRAFT_701334 [Neocallimastix californiae]|eukprot:ORY59802.1 hypothetical protein LY90DRAFT_701334 [Neocallimastix californiae]
MATNQASNQEIFEKIVEVIFSNWTALQLAVDHSLAGLKTQEFYQNLFEEVINIFKVYKDQVEVSDLNENFLDFFSEIFNMDVEDDSPKQVGMLLVDAYKKTFIEGAGMEVLNTLLSKGKSNANKLSQVQGDDDDSSDEDNDVDNNDSMETDEGTTSQQQPAHHREPRSKRVVDEDGWETVTSRRRR